jgi:hypothetical protein
MRTVERLMSTGLPANTAALLGDTPEDGIELVGSVPDIAKVLSSAINRITNASAVNNAVRLPKATEYEGAAVIIINNTTFPINVFPAGDESINRGILGRSLQMLATTSQIFYHISPKDWAAR